MNDALAMAAASLGIAMGKAGTDTAIETADMALIPDDLRRVADAIVLGRCTVRIIQFNIAFALAVKAVFLVLALLGYTSLGTPSPPTPARPSSSLLRPCARSKSSRS